MHLEHFIISSSEESKAKRSWVIAETDTGGKERLVTKARRALCYLAVRKLGYKCTAVSKTLGIRAVTISKAVSLGSKLSEIEKIQKQMLGKWLPVLLSAVNKFAKYINRTDVPLFPSFSSFPKWLDFMMCIKQYQIVIVAWLPITIRPPITIFKYIFLTYL